jgi:hypothetical protein
MSLTELKERYTTEELKAGVRNPFIDETCTKLEIYVNNEDYKLFSAIAENMGVRPTDVIRSFLKQSARVIRDHDSEQKTYYTGGNETNG